MSDEGTTANPAGLLTQKAYARRRGWSKQYVNQLVRQGRIPLVGGRIDPIAADAALAGTRDPSRGFYPRANPAASATAVSPPTIGPEAAPGVQGTFAKARTVREHFRALREKMEYEAVAGELVSRKEIEVAAHEIGILFREHMTRAADPIAAMIAKHLKVDYSSASELLRNGINQALEQLGNHIRDNEWGFDKGLPRRGDADRDGNR